MEKKKIQIKIDGIEIIEKQLFRANITDETRFSFEIKAQISADIKQNLTVVFTKVTISREENHSEILANLTIAVGYFIPDIKDHFPIINDEVRIPSEVDLLLRNVAISTMRGVLFSELRGTPLHKAYLPIVSPAQMQIDTIPIIESKS